jgi:phosphohistidine swiveling domain-containing protein
MSLLLKQRVLHKKEDLLRLFYLFKKAYPWFLAMWDATSDEKESGSIDVSIIRKFRVTINTFNDDLDNIINESLKVIFPAITDYPHVLAIEEIESGILPSLSILKERDQGFIYTDEKLFGVNELSSIEDHYNIKLQNNIIEKTEILKGDIACMGIAQGYVKRVMGLRNIIDFKEGDILVSPMTMPDFLPAMKKAAAIVTDEGGITCHAAILARELNKPCIVGTGIATSVFKNGDLVEVDANNGEIKIIHQHHYT